MVKVHKLLKIGDLVSAAVTFERAGEYAFKTDDECPPFQDYTVCGLVTLRYGALHSAFYECRVGLCSEPVYVRPRDIKLVGKANAAI